MTCTNHYVDKKETYESGDTEYADIQNRVNSTVWTVDKDVQEKINDILLFGAS